MFIDHELNYYSVKPTQNDSHIVQKLSCLERNSKIEILSKVDYLTCNSNQLYGQPGEIDF